MKHECGLCLRDNKTCKNGNSFWELLRGKTNNCIIFNDYHEALYRKNKGYGYKIKKKEVMQNTN